MGERKLAKNRTKRKKRRKKRKKKSGKRLLHSPKSEKPQASMVCSNVKKFKQLTLSRSPSRTNNRPPSCRWKFPTSRENNEKPNKNNLNIHNKLEPLLIALLILNQLVLPF